MKYNWNKLSRIGVPDGLETYRAKRIILTNQISVAWLPLILTYTCLFYFFRLWEMFYATLSLPLFFWFVLYMNYRGWHTASRLYFLLMINILLLVYCNALGYNSGISLVYVGFACVPWAFFEFSEWKYIAFSIFISLAFLLANFFLRPPGIYNMPVTISQTLFLSFEILISIMAGLSLGFLASQNRKSEDSLKLANNQLNFLLADLKRKNEILESQQQLKELNENLRKQAEELRASQEELKSQEEELRQTNAELEEKSEVIDLSNIALKKKAKELEATSRYKSEFLANMSHELRTPLNSILILASLLKENSRANLDAKQIEYATVIHKSGVDLLNLINDILDLSKIEAGGIEFQFETVKVSDLAADVESLFSIFAQDKKIQFSLQLLHGIPEEIKTDRFRLEQVLKNLLSNAFKFTPEGGKIIVLFSPDKNGIALSVADTGIGIEAGKQNQVFGAFQQGDGSISRRFGGTGLGLSISKEIVTRLGGTIELFSTAGKGSTFTIHIPVEAPSSVHLQDSSLDTRNTDGSGLDLSHVNPQDQIKDDKAEVKSGEKSVLIIEDDIVFASMVNDFAHRKGLKTIVALSGDEGLSYIREYEPSALILDLNLPVIDGRNILKIIKSDQKLKNIPVHVITADNNLKVANIEVESFFQKPIDNKDLEVAFSSIEFGLEKNYKNILILASDNSHLQNVFAYLKQNETSEIHYETAKTVEEAVNIIQTKPIQSIIVDTEGNLGDGMAALARLKEAADETVHFIICTEGEVSFEDEKELAQFSHSIVHKSSQTKRRLLDEIDLFLHTINNPQQNLIPEKYNQEVDKILQNKKLLLVDDDIRNVYALSSLLEEQGMQVLTAENGKEALEMLKTNKDVDIVLMDIMMPEMDGFEAMKHIRTDMRLHKLPIIALTAKAMTGDREKCIDSGASDYITKPIDNSQLFSLMRVWLSN